MCHINIPVTYTFSHPLTQPQRRKKYEERKNKFQDGSHSAACSYKSAAKWLDVATAGCRPLFNSVRTSERAMLKEQKREIFWFFAVSAPDFNEFVLFAMVSRHYHAVRTEP